MREIITFGHYPQSADGNDNTPIEWIVLDKKDDKTLLLSKYALECQKYNSSKTNITWADCTLRTWLNSTFIDKAFTADEQRSIQTTNVGNPDSYWGYDSDGNLEGNNTRSGITNLRYHVSGGNNTQDKVFLLSIDEAKSLLGYERQTLTSKSGRTYTVYPNMQAACTDYAYSQGAYRSSYYITPAGEACCWWWLRSPGNHIKHASDVYDDGRVSHYDVDHCCDVVRPALWVKMKS